MVDGRQGREIKGTIKKQRQAENSKTERGVGRREIK